MLASELIIVLASMLTRAIVRPPAPNFAEGLTRADLGAPDYQKALAQHEAYCEALQECGLALTHLAPEPEFPDSTFVEDTAVLAGRSAILTRPGASSREGEVAAIRGAIRSFFSKPFEIVAPGTVDGGDVCEAGNKVFIGISHRTNQAGAEQLAHFLVSEGKTTTFVDIRETPGILHLKSGIAYLGENRLLVIDALARHEAFAGFALVPGAPAEEYAANCVRVNDRLLVAAGFPKTEERLSGLGYRIVTVEMSEFQKMDGGLSCLSLRF
jgi:dimethylargininase